MAQMNKWKKEESTKEKYQIKKMERRKEAQRKKNWRQFIRLNVNKWCWYSENEEEKTEYSFLRKGYSLRECSLFKAFKERSPFLFFLTLHVTWRAEQKMKWWLLQTCLLLISVHFHSLRWFHLTWLSVLVVSLLPSYTHLY